MTCSEINTYLLNTFAALNISLSSWMRKIQYSKSLYAARFPTQDLHPQDTTPAFTPKSITVGEMVGEKRQFQQITLQLS